MLLGLATEFIGVIVELALVYWLINSLLNHRDEKRWAPARAIIVKHIAKSYSSIFNAANWTISEATHQSSNDVEQQFQMRLSFVNRASHDLQKLQVSVDINSPALDAELMPLITIFMDKAEHVISKLKFFANSYAPIGASVDITGDSPLAELKEISNVVDALKKKYGIIFSDQNNVFNGLLSYAELEKLWKKVAEDRHLCFVAEEYQQREGKLPFVYNTTSMKRLRNLKDGTRIHVFGMYL